MLVLKPVQTAFALSFLATGALAVPAFADEKAEPPLSHEEIKITVDKHLADVKLCMKQKGTASGKLVVKFAILPNGHVRDPKVDEGSSNRELDGCIAEAFRGWEFPRPRGGVIMGVVYPFVFAPPKNLPTIGTLEPGQIEGILSAHKSEVRDCYQKALSTDSELAGVIKVELTVAPTGAVIGARVVDTTMKAMTVQECVTGAIKKWQFPKPQGGGNLVFSYPIIMKPENKK